MHWKQNQLLVFIRVLVGASVTLCLYNAIKNKKNKKLVSKIKVKKYKNLINESGKKLNKQKY